jgi:Glycoside hydrolase family 44/PASTA domain
MRIRRLVSLLALVALLPVSNAVADPGPALSVDAAAGRHAISPYIYGWNFAPSPLAAQIDLPVDRRGGNKADTINWQTGVENTSNDYYFENLPSCWTDCPAGWDPARAYTDQIDFDRTVGAKTLIDIPMLGYVPKPPAKFDHPFDCSFPKTVFATQDSFDPFDTNCGNGKHNNSYVTNTAQTSDAIAAGADFQGPWVDDLKSRYNTAANGGVAFYELGNEPGLWNDTHHDWHPLQATYDELRDKSLALAAQVKSRDPSASVLAFSEWGWPNYFESTPADRAAHGGTELAAWLLQQFKADADANFGRRLIDYFDLHYYRQGGAGIEPTRSLWDPTYTDPSWINDTIRLLPRMHDWVDQNYPGTKISLSEYDLSNGDTNEDNLIEADTLGIFARERLDLATLWPQTDTDHYADAFKLFRNYDGAKSKFGDTYVQSQSANQSQLAVYGAQRSSDGALTLVVVNKSSSELTSDVGLAGFTPGGPAQVWRWTGTASGIQRMPDQAVAAGGFTGTFAPRSMTMIVIPPATPSSGGSNLPAGSDQGAPVPSPSGSTVVRCKVPKLTGLTLKKAKAKLKKARCRLGKVTKKRSAKRKGRVIAQKPKRGSVRKAGTKVSVVLSRGR